MMQEFELGFFNFPFGVWINLLFLQRIHQVLADSFRKADTHNENPLSKEDLEEARRMMGYYTTSYGAAMVNAVGTTCTTKRISRTSLFMRPVKSFSETLVRFNGLRQDSVEVLVDNPGCDTQYTQHSLLLDHARREAVLSIRGTWPIADFLTDLDIQQESFCGGYAHKGFSNSMAENTWNLLEETITAQIPDDYRLIIVGHSMGGAVAALLTMKILHDNKLPGKQLSCHAFGAPAVFAAGDETGEKTLKLVRPHITNYIHQDDCVSCLQSLTLRKTNAALCLMDRTR
jgi:predicted lipase